MKNVIIVGASHAGVAITDALRRCGFAGQLMLVDRLSGLPLERPPLSKAFLLADPASSSDAFLLRGADWYADNDITLRMGCAVSGVDPTTKTITLDTGETCEYGALVLATGAVPRMLPDAVGLAGVHVLRSPDDAAGLRHDLQATKRAIVVGGGYIGLEAAACLRKAGKQVHVIEMADRLLARVASPEISTFFHDLHFANGVHLHVASGVDAICHSDGRFTGVTLSDGTNLDAELLLVGIGVVPEMTLATLAGVACDNGVLVGPDMQTNIPGIYAIGDVALAPALAPRLNGTAIRVESVHNATDSAARAAAALMAMDPPVWQAPWFWSEQFDVRLQSAGIVPPDGPRVRHVVRPGKRDGGLSVWSFDDSRLCAVEAVRDSAGYMYGKKCLDAGLTPGPDKVADQAFDLKAFLAG